jgi:hypothetical protein
MPKMLYSRNFPFSTLEFRPSTFGPRLSNLDLDFRTSTYDPRPMTLDPRPMTLDTRHSTITQTPVKLVTSKVTLLNTCEKLKITHEKQLDLGNIKSKVNETCYCETTVKHVCHN